MKPTDYVVSVARAREYEKRDRTADVLKGMSAGNVIRLVESMGLGRFLYHWTLTTFIKAKGTSHGEALAVGLWLIANRSAVQAYFADRSDQQRSEGMKDAA